MEPYCHICDGDGYVPARDPHDDHFEDVCPLCNGSGDPITRAHADSLNERLANMAAQVQVLGAELEEVQRRLTIARAGLVVIGVERGRRGSYARSTLAAIHGSDDPGALEIIELAKQLDEIERLQKDLSAARDYIASIEDAPEPTA